MNDQDQGHGLTLPPALGPGEAQQHEITERWDTFDEQEYELARAGFQPVEQPRHVCPTLTVDMLTTPDSKSYTTTYLEIEAWHNYAFNMMSRINASLLQITTEKNDLERDIRLSILKSLVKGQKKPTKDEIKDSVESHPRYRELTIEGQKLTQQKLLLSSHVDRLDRDLKLVSRQVEIRRQDIDGGRAGGNMPSRGRPVPGRLA